MLFNPDPRRPETSPHLSTGGHQCPHRGRNIHKRRGQGERQKTHKVKQMLPLIQEQIVKILILAAEDKLQPHITLALLMMYYTGSRQSEVAPQSAQGYDPSRHTTRQDVFQQQNSLIIHSKWSKTMQGFDQERTLAIPAATDNRLCALTAYNAHLDMAPTIYTNQPLLVFPDSYKPVTTPWLTTKLRAIISKMGMDPACYSLHSLRRSAASLAYQSECDHLQVQRFRAWSSQAYTQYVYQQAANQVTATLVRDASTRPPTHPT